MWLTTALYDGGGGGSFAGIYGGGSIEYGGGIGAVGPGGGCIGADGYISPGGLSGALG